MTDRDRMTIDQYRANLAEKPVIRAPLKGAPMSWDYHFEVHHWVGGGFEPFASCESREDGQVIAATLYEPTCVVLVSTDQS